MEFTQSYTKLPFTAPETTPAIAHFVPMLIDPHFRAALIDQNSVAKGLNEWLTTPEL